MGWVLIKAVSLAYVLGAVSLSLASLCWWLLRRGLVPAQRADAGFAALLISALASLGFGTAIAAGVITRHIRMTTHYFHGLMYGNLAQAITVSGWAVMLLSLGLLLRSMLRARLPRDPGVIAELGGFRMRESAAVATASLVGAVRPELWINPRYWTAIAPSDRAIVLRHEQAHFQRRDNLRKLALQYVAGLYYALPWIRRWPECYELDSELAVDDACRGCIAEEQYRAVIGVAMKIALQLQPVAVHSSLTQADLRERLRVLLAPRRSGSITAAALGVLLLIVLSALPAVLLLSHPVTRCFFACYLGY
jgi:hypothetical protein